MYLSWQNSLLAISPLSIGISQATAWRSLYPCCLNATQETYPRVVVKDYNVYLINETGSEVVLSTTGTRGTPFDPANIYKSPDGKFVVVHQIQTYGQNRSITLVDSSPNDQFHPKLVTFSYDTQYDRGKPHTYGSSIYLAGDDLPVVRPSLFDLAARRQIEIKTDFIDNPYMIEDASWNYKGNTYRFMYYERGLRRMRMVEIDITGDARIILEETAEHYVDYYTKPAWVFLNRTEQILYLSEADGYNNVYLVNTTFVEGQSASSVTISPSGHGNMIQQVTRGNFSVFDVIHVDEEQRAIFLTGYGLVDTQDPYYLHLARVNYDGSNFKVLTAVGDGNHRISWLENNTFEDTWSRVDQPLRGVLRNEHGDTIADLETNSTVRADITIPERFNTPGRDGSTQIYGIIVKPSYFDPTERYRVIEHIYNGPPVFNVIKGLERWEQDILWHLQELSDTHGVVVVVIDGMGTNGRGRAFQQITYKDFKDSGFVDRRIWINAAATTRPWIDLSGGVGIYGTSHGGYNAMAALLWQGDFYTAAIADAGNHDQRLANAEYGEVFMGWPVDNALYDANSNVMNAHLLNGSLLLLVGELDDNVDPSCTLQVVNALNAAGKDFDFMIVPGAGHGVLSLQSIIQLRAKVTKFWDSWLSSTKS